MEPLRMYRYGRKIALLCSIMLAGYSPSSAYAHVKWFAPYDVAGQPRALVDVFSPTFLHLVAFSLFALYIGSLIERTALGDGLLRSMDRICAALQPRTEDLLRA